MSKVRRWFLTASGLALALGLANANGPALADGGNGVIASARGSGHYTSGGELRTFGLTASKQADGSVSGEYQIISRAGAGAVFHVNVTCMSVVGNQAWVGGIITRADDPTIIVGSVSYFRAIDNGEGPDSPPDQVSPARINDRAGEDIRFCTERPTLLPLRDVEHGNVQISGESESGGLLLPSYGLRVVGSGCTLDPWGCPNGAWLPANKANGVCIDPDGCASSAVVRTEAASIGMDGNG